ncbi:MAG: hypothetical protein ABW352_23175 [Polyangiales bacterium]
MSWSRTFVVVAFALGGCSDPAYSSPSGDPADAATSPGNPPAADSRADAGAPPADAASPAVIDAGVTHDSSVEPDAEATPSVDAATPDAAAPMPQPDASTPLKNMCPMGMICSASTDGLVQSTLTAYTNNVPYCADPTTLIPPTCTDDPDCDLFGFSLAAVCVYDLSLFPRAFCMQRCNY